MRMKVNYRQLPVKAHYFFFMAAMGPILPYLPVYGKEIGVSPLVMGTITAILPILFLIAKPAFGFLVDYFYSQRKTIFIILLAVTGGCYITMYFLPKLPGPVLPDHSFNKSCDQIKFCSPEDKSDLCFKNAKCNWTCADTSFSVSMEFREASEQTDISLSTACIMEPLNITSYCFKNSTCNVTCDEPEDSCLYVSVTFWGFVLLMSLGNIGFNVSNCISDAICFDVLGDGGEMGYGRQRVWGTIGFGIAALAAGYAGDLWSKEGIIETYTPAFVLVFVFTVIDIICCNKLDLPRMTESESILKDVFGLLKLKPIMIFLCFATIAGILDSFMIYFLFWYLEDLAMATWGNMNQIKTIEGLIVAAETLGGEIIFFSFSGKILKKLGFGYTFTFCFLCYALRLGLISVAANPWWVILIELFMQGPTYALCYTSIVAYASKVAPPGTSATVQGIVAGMDDGFGFAIGSLIGGIFYKLYGGVMTLRIFSSLAVVTAFIYLTLYRLYLKDLTPETKNHADKVYKTPEEAQKTCTVEDT